MANIQILMHPKEVKALAAELETDYPVITIHSVVTLDMKSEPDQIKFKPKPKFVLMKTYHSYQVQNGEGQFIDFVENISSAIQYIKDNYEVSDGGIGTSIIEPVSERLFFSVLISRQPIQFFYLIPIE